MSWYFEVLGNYAGFSGRARRKEYWMFFLVNTIVQAAIILVERALGGTGVFYFLYLLFTFMPVIAVGVRRLHDSDHSGWWLLLPVVNLVFLLLDSQPGDNHYGPNPKGAAPATSIAHSGSMQPQSGASTNTQSIHTVSDNSEGQVNEDDEDKIYGKIAEELDGGNLHKSTWTKAYAGCNGDESKAKSLYIRLRFERLSSDQSQSKKSRETVQPSLPILEERERVSLLESSLETECSEAAKNANWISFAFLILDVSEILCAEVGLKNSV